MRGRIQLQMPSIRRVPWGFFEPDVTIVDGRGYVIVRPANTDGYPDGSMIRANGFDCHQFAALTTVHEKVECLHTAGFDAVPVKEDYVIAYPDEGPSVEGEDRLRLLYHRWQSRRSLMPSDTPRGCPFRLCHDAKVASAIVESSESMSSHIDLAREYVAAHDWNESLERYDTDTMHSTVLTMMSVAEADADTMDDVSAEILGMSERADDERMSEYLDDLGARLRNLE